MNRRPPRSPTQLRPPTSAPGSAAQPPGSDLAHPRLTRTLSQHNSLGPGLFELDVFYQDVNRSASEEEPSGTRDAGPTPKRLPSGPPNASTIPRVPPPNVAAPTTVTAGPGGGTGRRRGLKPPGWQHLVGSNPTPGTQRTTSVRTATGAERSPPRWRARRCSPSCVNGRSRMRPCGRGTLRPMPRRARVRRRGSR